MNHLVILHKPYLDQILSGAKTVESRLSRRRHPAATRLHEGDHLYLKRAGGDVLARATAGTITVVDGLTPEGVDALARKWEGRVDGGVPDGTYWRAKRDARHALFVELRDVRPCHIPHWLFSRNLAWPSGWIIGQPSGEVLAQKQGGAHSTSQQCSHTSSP